MLLTLIAPTCTAYQKKVRDFCTSLQVTANRLRSSQLSILFQGTMAFSFLGLHKRYYAELCLNNRTSSLNLPYLSAFEFLAFFARAAGSLDMCANIHCSVLVNWTTYMIFVQLGFADRDSGIDCRLSYAAMIWCFAVFLLITERA